MAKTILFLCYDQKILQQRKAVLEDAGYRVRATTNDSEAFELLSHGQFDLVIIGDKMPSHRRSELDKKAKK